MKAILIGVASSIAFIVLLYVVWAFLLVQALKP